MHLLAACLVAGVVVTAAGTDAGPFDFTKFEDEVLAKWLRSFAIDFDAGLFSYFPLSSNATSSAELYGTLDATHILASVGQAQQFTDAMVFMNFQGMLPDDSRTTVLARPHHPWHFSAASQSTTPACLRIVLRLASLRGTASLIRFLMALSASSKALEATTFMPAGRLSAACLLC
jgi:hypothetical protein